MALIKCPECQIEVSDKAKVCPKCGCPIGEDGTQTVQLTSKKYKGQVIVSIVIMVIGALLLLVAFRNYWVGNWGLVKMPRSLGAMLFGGGLLWYIVVKALIYWHHE